MYIYSYNVDLNITQPGRDSELAPPLTVSRPVVNPFNGNVPLEPLETVLENSFQNNTPHRRQRTDITPPIPLQRSDFIPQVGPGRPVAAKIYKCRKCPNKC